VFYHGGQTLVDTQPDPTITIRGISPYSKTDCFVVTAFKGSQESAASNEWCGASNLAMGIADTQIYPTVMETRTGVTPTACSPNQHIEIDKGPLIEGVGLAFVRGPNWCWPTVVYHGYMGFHVNVPGRVWKAVLTVPYFAGECNIQGVVKTQYTSWFASSPMAVIQAPLLGSGSTVSYLPTDISSERNFNLNSELIPEGYVKQPYAYGTVDVTSWLQSNGATDLGLGFYKTKYYNPSDTSQPDQTAENIGKNVFCLSNPICAAVVYVGGAQLAGTSQTSSNPPDDFTPCVHNFGDVWLDVQYYPSS
jgi:hypothetical protein